MHMHVLIIMLSTTCISYSWLSASRNEQAKLLYQADEASYLREAKGLVASSHHYCFDRRSIQLFKLRELCRFEDPKRVRTIHTGIDPSGGGSASDFALLSIYFNNGRKVVSVAIHNFILILISWTSSTFLSNFNPRITSRCVNSSSDPLTFSETWMNQWPFTCGRIGLEAIVTFMGWEDWICPFRYAGRKMARSW